MDPRSFRTDRAGLTLGLGLLLSVAAGVCGHAAPPLAADAQAPTFHWRVKALAVGKLLVASRELLDPNFAQRVVLLLDYGRDGAAGLIVNVEAAVPLSGLFAHLVLGSNGARPTFTGGPMSPASALALVRSQSPVAGARPVTPGICLVASRDLLEQTLTTPGNPDRFRVYLGRAGWGPGQLERETSRGAWHVFDVEPALVFDPDPATVWHRLIRRAEFPQASVYPFPDTDP
jgi:putative transcriptional regulator